MPDDSPLTLLYIDDRLANRVLMREAIARLTDLTLMAVESGQDGLLAAKVYQPDAILLDLNLGDEDGEVVLQRLKEDAETQHIPVFVLSVDASPSRWATMRELGASGRILMVPQLDLLVQSVCAAVRTKS